jgi:hypothetical protein
MTPQTTGREPAEAEGRPKMTREEILARRHYWLLRLEGKREGNSIENRVMVEICNLALAHLESKLAEAPKEGM